MMLLEDEDYMKVLYSVKKFKKDPTSEHRNDLVNDLRKKITEHAKGLMTDEQINKFINDMPNIGEIEELAP